MPLHRAEHLTDLLVLNRFREHPTRALEASGASLHVLGALLLFASFIADCNGVKGPHHERMNDTMSWLAIHQSVPEFPLPTH